MGYSKLANDYKISWLSKKVFGIDVNYHQNERLFQQLGGTIIHQALLKSLSPVWKLLVRFRVFEFPLFPCQLSAI